MINPISSTAGSSPVQAIQNNTRTPAQTQAQPKEDSVHLSPQALKAAAGDKDGDGDAK